MCTAMAINMPVLIPDFLPLPPATQQGTSRERRDRQQNHGCVADEDAELVREQAEALLDGVALAKGS